jgi:ribosomal protein S27AE
MVDREAVDSRWQAGYQRAMEQVQTWRRAHPRATFAEIEAALDAQLRALRAEMLTDLVASDAAGQVAGRPTQERPGCPECGAAVVSLGQRTRQVLVDGDHPVAVSRAYTRCPRCGAGHFPPG